MRKSLVFGLVFSFTLVSTFEANFKLSSSTAQIHQQQQSINQPRADQLRNGTTNNLPNEAFTIWQLMPFSERVIVDRLASDFYERSLRYAQTQAIENNTAKHYRGATPATRTGYRQQRRQQWRKLNTQQQNALRNAKRPLFVHLNDQQKWPFRQHALHQLGAAGAIRQTPQNYGTGI